MRRFFLIAVLIFSVQSLTFAAEIPNTPTQNIYVNDYAAMIDAETKEKILAIGKTLDEKYKAQIVIVTINTLDDLSIEEYANNLFNKWSIGDKELNNGVLLLIAKDDRKFRIEVGYGLEGAITDGYAGEILDDMTNYFRDENYSAGILTAYSTLVKKVYEEYGGEVPENVSSEAVEEELSILDMIIYGIVIIFGILRMIEIIIFLIKLVLTILLTFFAYIFNVINYVVSGGNRGTLNIIKVIDWSSSIIGNLYIFTIIGSSSKSGGGGFGGGRSGGGGASGGW